MSWNDNTPISEQTNSADVKTYTVKIVDAVEDSLELNGTKSATVNFTLKEVSNLFTINTHVFLNGKSEPAFYPSFVGKDGTKVAASIPYEIAQKIKEKMGEDKYEERKKAAGGLNRKFFKLAEFDIAVKKFEKDSNTYWFPQWEKEILKQEQKRQEYVKKEEEESINPNDLPF